MSVSNKKEDSSEEEIKSVKGFYDTLKNYVNKPGNDKASLPKSDNKPADSVVSNDE